MNEDDFTSDLPEGWALPTIRECVDLKYGKGLPKRNRVKGSIRVYGSNGVVGFHNQEVTAGETIVIGRKGTVGAVHYSDSACWPIDTTYFIDEFYGLSPSYLTHALRYADLARLESSTAIPGLNRDDIYGQRFPLASVPEQDRIAAKLEELLNCVEKDKKHLERVPAILEKFCKAVLDSAYSGRLTEDWRKKHPDIEPGAILIERAYQKRLREYEDACKKGKMEGRKTKKKPVLQDSDVLGTAGKERIRSSDLPESWAFPTIRACVELKYGKGLTKRKRAKGSVPVYGSSGIVGHHDRALTVGQTIILGRKGTVGAVHYSELACWPIDTTYFIDEFYYLHPVYCMFALRYLNLATLESSTAIPGLNRNDIYRKHIPVAPLAEQEEIVHRVEVLFKLADSIEGRVEAAKEKAEKLTQSILSKAFRGELVPTEAELAKIEGREYETAQQLLERIKAEKETKQKRKRRIKKRVKITEYISVAGEVNVEIKMKSSLFKIISERGKNIKPEDLLEASKYSIGTIEDFYEELARLEKEGEIEDFRPNNIVSVIRVKK